MDYSQLDYTHFDYYEVWSITVWTIQDYKYTRTFAVWFDMTNGLKKLTTKSPFIRKHCPVLKGLHGPSLDDSVATCSLNVA